MNPRELVEHIRSGPAELVLDKPLRFRRRTRSNPCDFNEFLQALQSSETIRTVTCYFRLRLSITEDEWVLLVQRIGRITDIQNLTLLYRAGSREFRPFQAIADALKNARSLRALALDLDSPESPSDSSGLTALTNALREHTTLREFCWIDRSQTVESASLDPVLRALPACPHLREVLIKTKNASAGAMKALLQLPKDTDLALFDTTKEQWLAVADGIRQGQCNIKTLHLSRLSQNTSPQATEVVKAIASAIRLDHNLEHLTLHINDDITDEAGVVLAEALTVNTTLRKVNLYLRRSWQSQDAVMLSAPAYNAFSAMLRVNTYLALELHPLIDDAVGDHRLVDSRNQMRIEQRLNYVGRGRLLSSSQTPREEWVDALKDLNSSNVDESLEFNVSCLYSLLRLNPATCMS
jgi:predicted metal-dependent HD superfamily phosphohydrolase